MAVEYTATAHRFGIASAILVIALTVVYRVTLVTLVVGFLSLTSPDQPIGNPMFSIMQMLIILMMPAMVALMVAVPPNAAFATNLRHEADVVRRRRHFERLVLPLSRRPRWAAVGIRGFPVAPMHL